MVKKKKRLPVFLVVPPGEGACTKTKRLPRRGYYGGDYGFSFNSTCAFALPNLSHVTLVWTVRGAEVAPAFGSAVPTVSASGTPSSADSRDGEKGGGKGKGKGGSKGGCRGPGKKSKNGDGQTDVGVRLCEPWNDEVHRIMEENKRGWRWTVDNTTRREDTMTVLRRV